MKYVSLILLALLLASCAHQTAQPTSTIRDMWTYQRQLATLQHWQLDGKIAIRHADKSDSAAVHWAQEKSAFDIFLSGPLGAHATRIAGTPESVQITNSNGEHQADGNAEDVIEKLLGWTFPVEQLPQWILGATDNHRAQFNPDHTLANLEQDGWQVQYLSYQNVGSWLLPEKIRLQHEDMTVTIVIKQWSL